MKSVKYLSGIVIFIIFHSVNSFSQTNFSKGYIVDNQKDTVKGLIDYRNWNKTPKEIAFKNVSGSKPITYTAADIRSFSVAGERYVSGIVPIDESPMRDEDLTESFLPQYRIDTVFLQILIDGPKSLYYHKDNNLKAHFYIGQPAGLEPLVYKRYLQNLNGVLHIKKNEKYKGQIVFYLQDYPSIQKRVNSVTCSKNDLISLFNDYCKFTHNEKLFYQQKKDKFKLEFGLLAGLSETQVKFGGDFKDKLTSSTNFTFGGFFNIVVPRIQHRLSLDNEFMYLQFDANRNFRDDQNASIYTVYSGSFGTTFIKVNNLIKYKLPIKNNLLFIDAGISNGFSISQTNFMKAEEHIYSDTNIFDGKAIVNPRNSEVGLLIGLGFNLKNYSCEFRFERLENTDKITGPKGPNRMHLFVGYRF